MKTVVPSQSPGAILTVLYLDGQCTALPASSTDPTTSNLNVTDALGVF